MSKKNTIGSLFILLFCFTTSLLSQNLYDFGFHRNDSIVVLNQQNDTLDFPWVGGLNSVHLQSIDLNLDNRMDLVVFDRHGNKVLPFLRNTATGINSFKYAPEYIGRFPEINAWIQLIDYNCDGKKDIFTSYPAGISVYKNVSTVSTGLQFQLITVMLNSDHGGSSPSNIFNSSVDFPAITDVDGDGDYDILGFGVLGGMVDYHKNLSKEMYGDFDHLTYKRMDKCWGKFFEPESSNIVFNIQCSSKVLADGSLNDQTQSKNGAKHTGSTMLAIDLDNDSVKDLLLGDVDFFNIRALFNGGTRDSALMVSQDSLYPIYDTSIRVISFPVTNFIDVDNDGVNELFVAPFDDTYYTAATKNQTWLYENYGSNTAPNFKLFSKNFLQNEMIDLNDNASPSVVDVDGDGLMDLIVGNYGQVDSAFINNENILHIVKSASLSYFKNIGTITKPAFKLIDENWMNINAEKFVGIKPSFGDLNGDSAVDMILGLSDGTLVFYPNTANPGQALSLGIPQKNYKQIDVDAFAAPQIFDLNSDSLLDLVIGNKRGWIKYYKNVGTKVNPVFQLEKDSLGMVQTIDYWNSSNGFCSPFFVRNQQDSLFLFAGGTGGYVYFYRNIKNNLNGEFFIDSTMSFIKYYDTIYSTAFTNMPNNGMALIYDGIRSAPCLYDFNHDGYLDLVNGNFSGGLSYYSGEKGLSIGYSLSEITAPDFELFPNPASDLLTIQLSESYNFKSIELSIFDLPGRKLKTTAITNQSKTTISISDLAKGVYLVQIIGIDYHGKATTSTKKLIKQ